jgi:Alpha-glutamyl/putrescinyl thymine pyrophosphorylase clade 2
MNYKDYRLPENRMEGFDKFYEFHCLTNDCSPDIAVETWIANDLDFDFEKRCVMALFHGATYAGPCESMFADKFPIMTSDVQPLVDFFFQNKKRLLFSPDCKYRKIYFDEFLYSVGKAIEPYGTLGKLISSCFTSDDKYKNYLQLKTLCETKFKHWGRMGHWCFSEAIERFINAPILPPTMEFADGKSHRSGWAFCIGRDDLTGDKITKEEVQLLEDTAAEYIKDKKFVRAGFFTLETACCNYKRQHRGSRYGGCYIDEQYVETIQMMSDWPEYDWLWQKYLEGRQAVIPHELLYELNQHESDTAYCKDWVHCLKDYGRIPRIEAYFNKQPQRWTSIKNMPFYGNTLLSLFD